MAWSKVRKMDGLSVAQMEYLRWVRLSAQWRADSRADPMACLKEYLRWVDSWYGSL